MLGLLSSLSLAAEAAAAAKADLQALVQLAALEPAGNRKSISGNLIKKRAEAQSAIMAGAARGIGEY